MILSLVLCEMMQKFFFSRKEMTSYKTRLSIKTVGQIEFVVQNAQVFRAHEMVVKRDLVISENFIPYPIDLNFNCS